MTREEIATQIIVRGGWSTTYSVSEANLFLFVDRAHKFCAGYKKWPDTEGRVSTTFASLVSNEDGYLTGSYPEGWKSDSIRRLTIGGKKVGKKEFYKFCDWLEQNTGSTMRLFSDFNGNYYINPNIDLSGTVTTWGQFTPAALVEGSNTVFTNNTEADEAVIDYGMGLVYERLGDKKSWQVKVKAAQDRLDILGKTIGDEKAGYQTPPGDQGIFERLDVTHGRGNDTLPRSENNWEN